MQTLADKFRPTCVDDIVGQEHILGKGKVLRRLIESKNVSNLILFRKSRYREDNHCTI